MGIFATGVVYGCNPDALFCVIPAITLPTKLAAATYTAMFVLGTVGAMGGYTAFIGQPSHLRMCCAVLCCAVLTTQLVMSLHSTRLMSLAWICLLAQEQPISRIDCSCVLSIAIVKDLVSSKMREQGGACRCCLKKRI